MILGSEDPLKMEMATHSSILTRGAWWARVHGITRIRHDLASKPQLPQENTMCLVVQLCPTPCDPMDCSPTGSSVHGDSSGKNTGMGCHALLQGIFPTQRLNPGLLHCRQILHHLSCQGSPRILERAAYPFSRESSQPRNRTMVF